MSLLKSKQLDLNDLATKLLDVISNNNTYKTLWMSVINSTFMTAVFSQGNANISNGQSNFVVSYPLTPTEIMVFRDGIKLVESVDYSITNNTNSFTVTLNLPINASTGAKLSELIEINYY